MGRQRYRHFFMHGPPALRHNYVAEDLEVVAGASSFEGVEEDVS
jgi:hypothetical protein